MPTPESEKYLRRLPRQPGRIHQLDLEVDEGLAAANEPNQVGESGNKGQLLVSRRERKT